MPFYEIDESNTTEKCKRTGCDAVRWNQWWCQPHMINSFLAAIQFKHETGLEARDEWFTAEGGFSPPMLRPGLNIIVINSATPKRRDRSPKRVKKQPVPSPKPAVAKKAKVKKVPAPAKAKAAPKAPPPVKLPPKATLPKANPVTLAQEAVASTVARYLPTKTASRPPKPLTPEAGYKLAKERKQQETTARVKLEAKLKRPTRVKSETE